jgi:hypothetical protein
LNNGDLISVYGPRDISSSSTPSWIFSNSSGVFYSTDGGITWADVTLTAMQKEVVNVEIDPNDPDQNTWLAFVGNKAIAPGVYRTTDKGQSWTNVYNQGVLSGSFHPTLPNTLYICTELDGLVSASNTNSNSFAITPVSSYPFRRPQRVFFNPYDVNEVWVANFGNGFRVGMTNLPAGISADSFSYNDIIMYPNPVSNVLAFSETLYNLEVYNHKGQLVISKIKSANCISLQGLANGVYFIRTQKSTLRVVVLH